MIEVSWAILSDKRIRGNTIVRDDFSREIQAGNHLLVSGLPGATSALTFTNAAAWEVWWDQVNQQVAEPVRFY